MPSLDLSGLLGHLFGSGGGSIEIDENEAVPMPSPEPEEAPNPYVGYKTPDITLEVVDEDAENVDTILIDYEDNQLIAFVPAYATDVSFDEKTYRRYWLSKQTMLPLRSCINYEIDGTKQARSCIFYSPSEELLSIGSEPNPRNPYYNHLEEESLCLNPLLRVRDSWIAVSHPECHVELHKACPWAVLEDWSDTYFAMTDDHECVLQMRLGGFRVPTYRVITYIDGELHVNMVFERTTTHEAAFSWYEDHVAETYPEAVIIKRSEVEEVEDSEAKGSFFSGLLMGNP